MDYSSDEELPQEIVQAATDANLELLPTKSKQRYEKQYTSFIEWCNNKKVKTPNKEEVFLAYFLEMSKTWKPNTLWARYSMLKSVFKVKQNLDISKFYKIIAFIKRQNVGFRPKKAKIFTQEDVSKFMTEAPDDIYLMIKLVAIFGLAGACRREELTKLTIDDIDDKENLIIVNIKDSKNHSSRSFVISEEANDGYFLNVYRNYVHLRPKETPHRRLFLYYKSGKCTMQCVGINTIGKIPSEIAVYLRLQNPELYTGHSFRRSSATLLADCGVGITNIKRLGGWKSTSVAEGYLEDSTNRKKEMSNKILNLNTTSSSGCILEPSTSISIGDDLMPVPAHSISFDNVLPELPSSSGNQPSSKNMLASAMNLHNASNCTFTINITNN